MSGDIGSSRNYILITPCKNEAENLPSLVNSVVNQTITPIVWVVIDDGSTDDTPNILNDYQNKYKWIKVLRLEESPRDLGLHLASVMEKGFNYAIDFCNKEKIVYNYLGNIDGDLTIQDTFFKNLIIEFEKDSKLGIASGGLIVTTADGLRHVKGLPVDEPSGGDMLVRRKCFEDCKGIPQSYAYDSVFKAKARLRGWKTKRCEENLVTEARDVGSAEGYLKGFLHMGKTSYYLNLHPLHVFIRGFHKSMTKPHYGGTVYILSYLYCVLKRSKQVEDEEIKGYFWNKWRNKQYRLFPGIRHEAVEKK